MSRLPAESVIRCKSVCRSWRSLLDLNSHYFSRLHLQQQKQIANRGNQTDFLIKYNPVTGQDFQFLDYIDHGDRENQVVRDSIKDDVDEEYYSTFFSNYRVRNIYHPLKHNSRYRDFKRSERFDHFIQVEGSCDGLVCVSCYRDPTYICNPVTREYVNLPKHDQYHIRDSTTSSYIVSGFGRSHPLQHNNAHTEYKVVRIYYEKRGIGCKGQVEVYTVGKDQGRWRNIGHISHILNNSQRGILVNGTLYWLAVWYSVPRSGIVAFDLALEKFYVVTAKVPEEWYNYEGLTRFRELGGCLCIIKLMDSHSTCVWALKKNSTRKNDEEEYSWAKEFIVPENWSFCDPYTVTKNGEILAWYNHKNNKQVFLVRYDPKTGNTISYVDGSYIPRVNTNTWYGAVAHIKSFISLKDLGEENATVGGARRSEKVKGHTSLKRKASCLKKKF